MRRLTSKVIREMLRLKSMGLNNSQISASIGKSRPKVIEYLKKAKELELDWEKAQQLKDDELIKLFHPDTSVPRYKKPEPDFQWVHDELKRHKNLNLRFLWTEYKAQNAGGLEYSQYCARYREWAQRRNVTMVVEREPGYEMQVDWAGDKLEILCDRDTGELSKVHFFIATLGFSGYPYCEAFADEKMNSWIIAHIHALSSMFSMAIRWELMSTNPCSKVVKPKIKQDETLVLDEKDSKLLIKQMEHAPIKYRCIVLAAMTTGLRLGELVALKWQDIDFTNKTLKVDRAKSYVPGKGCFDKEPKTRTSKRSITVPQMLLDTFLLLKAEQARQKEQQKDNWHDNDYLFTAYGGLPMGHNTPTRWFKDFLADLRAKQQREQTAAGIPVSEQKLFPKMRFHDLRHIHASLLIGKGVDIQTVSRRLGHARASTTANIYGHPLMANDAKAAAIIETEFK